MDTNVHESLCSLVFRIYQFSFDFISGSRAEEYGFPLEINIRVNSCPFVVNFLSYYCSHD